MSFFHGSESRQGEKVVRRRIVGGRSDVLRFAATWIDYDHSDRCVLPGYEEGVAVSFDVLDNLLGRAGMGRPFDRSEPLDVCDVFRRVARWTEHERL